MRHHVMAAAAALCLVAGTTAASAQEKIRIGVMATLEGALTTLGEDGVRGAQVALKQAGGKLLGKDVELLFTSTNASPDSALRAAKKLVEQDKVSIIVGPLSGSEGIAIRDYSKTVPNVTFVNGSSGALETTFVTPSPSFFRYNWMARSGWPGSATTFSTRRSTRRS